jgi:aminoglycoside 6'-N-acetyltransferase
VRTDWEWDENKRERNPRIIPDRTSEFAIQQASVRSLSGAAFPQAKATRHRKNRSMVSPYTFRPLTPEDLPMVAKWLETPDVIRWWGDSREQLALITEDLNEPLMNQWLVEQEGNPFAYLQAYPARAWPQTHLAHLPATGKVIDVFVGDPTMIGRGHGRAFLRNFAEMLVAGGASLAATDPVVENHRARRAFSRAGFVENKMVSTADGLVAVMIFE